MDFLQLIRHTAAKWRFLKKWYFWVSVALLIAAIALLVAFLNRYRDFEDIVDDKELNVATEYSSIGYFVEDGTMKGFQYELVKRFADQHGLALNITVEDDLERCIVGVNKGVYDLILRNLPVTVELRRRIAFSDPILTSRLVLVQLSDNVYNEGVPLRNSLDLDGITVYAVEHSPYLPRLNHIREEIGVEFQVAHISGADTELLIAMVSRGEIPYAVSDEFTARLCKVYYPEIDIAMVLGFQQCQAWGMNKRASALQTEINSWLKEFKQTKDFRDLYRKYYKIK
jgi:membrane-bound lytic murein transglycosylase F